MSLVWKLALSLESMSGFELRHGEAVAIGVAIDAVYSSLALGFDSGEAARVVATIPGRNGKAK